MDNRELLESLSKSFTREGLAIELAFPSVLRRGRGDDLSIGRDENRIEEIAKGS